MGDFDIPRSGGGSYTEYGVLLDERERGLGVRLAEVTRSKHKADAVADHYRELGMGPVAVRVRRVHVTDWQTLTEHEQGEEGGR